MDNNQQAGVVTPAQQPAIAPVPTPTPVPSVPQQTPVQQVPQPVAQQTVSDAGDRTRQEFEKLLESNRKLHQANTLLQEEIARRANVQQQFAPMQQQAVAPQTPNIQDFVEIDPESGTKYINERKLQSAIAEANTRATQAVSQMQNYIQANEQREIEKQNREAFATYPELNPNDASFDRNFSNTTSALILHSYMNPRNYSDGRPLTFKEAADMLKKGQGISTQQVVQTTTPVAQPSGQPTAQDLKAQAAVSVQSMPQQVIATPEVVAEMQALRSKTRLGDDQALAERLKYTEHIIPKEGTS